MSSLKWLTGEGGSVCSVIALAWFICGCHYPQSTVGFEYLYSVLFFPARWTRIASRCNVFVCPSRLSSPWMPVAPEESLCTLFTHGFLLLAVWCLFHSRSEEDCVSPGQSKTSSYGPMAMRHLGHSFLVFFPEQPSFSLNRFHVLSKRQLSHLPPEVICCYFVLVWDSQPRGFPTSILASRTRVFSVSPFGQIHTYFMWEKCLWNRVVIFMVFSHHLIPDPF